MLISKFKTISEDEILEFEDALEIKFPEVYRTFIQKYNGGQTPNTSFNCNGIRSDIKGFYGIGNVKYSLNLLSVENVNGSCLLPIAMDSFGNDVLLDVNQGGVYFRNHESGGVMEIESSFKNFVDHCDSTNISKASVKSVEERENELIAKGRGNVITEALRDMWRAEIKKYSAISQEEVIL